MLKEKTGDISRRIRDKALALKQVCSEADRLGIAEFPDHRDEPPRNRESQEA